MHGSENGSEKIVVAADCVEKTTKEIILAITYAMAMAEKAFFNSIRSIAFHKSSMEL